VLGKRRLNAVCGVYANGTERSDTAADPAAGVQGACR
jgi:hypothetical protein